MRPGEAQEGWKSETLFGTGDEFFADVLKRIDEARSTVDFESYIFEPDVLGDRVVATLCRAAVRGVRVRIIVDAIGSPTWRSRYVEQLTAAGAECRIYHENTLGRYLSRNEVRSRRTIAWFLRRLNQRNHRKVAIVDGEFAWLGSMNVAKVHLRSENGDRAWRDTGVRVTGSGVAILEQSFEYIWADSRERRRLRRALNRAALPERACVRVNVTRTLRAAAYRDLQRVLGGAQNRIWVRSAYFVPHGAVLRALRRSARSGIDVRVLVPSRSDVVFMSWVAIALYRNLLRSGVRIFEYQPSMLHAKNLVVDDWMTVGSSNLNHRSLFHDLESDAVLCSEPARTALLKQFEEDYADSIEVHVHSWGAVRPFRWLIGNLLLLFRYWL